MKLFNMVLTVYVHTVPTEQILILSSRLFTISETKQKNKHLQQ